MPRFASWCVWDNDEHVLFLTTADPYGALLGNCAIILNTRCVLNIKLFYLLKFSLYISLLLLPALSFPPRVQVYKIRARIYTNTDTHTHSMSKTFPKCLCLEQLMFSWSTEVKLEGKPCGQINTWTYKTQVVMRSQVFADRHSKLA